MSPIVFPQSNCTFTPPDGLQGIGPLPVWTDGRRCVSCWSLSWRERLRLLFHGRIWLSVLSGGSQPPVALTPEREFFLED